MAASIKKSKNDLVATFGRSTFDYQNKRTMQNTIISLQDRRFVSDDSEDQFSFAEFVEANEDQLSEEDLMEVKLLEVFSTTTVGMCEVTRVK